MEDNVVQWCINHLQGAGTGTRAHTPGPGPTRSPQAKFMGTRAKLGWGERMQVKGAGTETGIKRGEGWGRRKVPPWHRGYHLTIKQQVGFHLTDAEALLKKGKQIPPHSNSLELWITLHEATDFLLHFVRPSVVTSQRREKKTQKTRKHQIAVCFALRATPSAQYLPWPSAVHFGEHGTAWESWENDCVLPTVAEFLLFSVSDWISFSSY